MYDSESSDSEDDLHVFKRVLKSLSFSGHPGYKIRTNTSLTRALDKLTSNPFLFFTNCTSDTPIRVKGEEAGTCMIPDISVIQKHATPTPSDEGEGMFRTELKAGVLTLSDDFVDFYSLESAMFVGRRIEFELIKLSICGEGEQLNWCRRDAHHAAVFVALNTEWEGGDLILKYGGEEVRVDMHPTTTPTVPYIKPVVVAFYTHMEHNFMPVTKGVQLVLQYDVEVMKEMPPPPLGFGVEDYDTLKEIILRRDCLNEARIPNYSTPEDTLIQAVINEIQKLHDEGTKDVGFPFFGLCRREKVERDHLTGIDAILLDALKDRFDISIDTVVIDYFREAMSRVTDCVAYRYSAVQTKSSRSSCEIDNEEYNPEGEYDSDGGFTYPYNFQGSIKKFASFHLPRTSAIEKIWCDYRNWNYNKRTTIQYRGVGLFVKSKDMDTANLRHAPSKRNESDGEGKEVQQDASSQADVCCT